MCYFPGISVDRWLGIRLEFVGAIVILLTAALAVAAVATSDGVDAGLVGMVLSYALSTTTSLVSAVLNGICVWLLSGWPEFFGAWGKRGGAERSERGAHRTLYE